MPEYRFEFRFRDEAQSHVKQLIYHLEAKFHLDFFKNNRPIPHVPLAGPVVATDEKKLVTDFVALCARTPFCPYDIGSYIFSDTAHAVCVRVDPGEALRTFRENLIQIIAMTAPGAIPAPATGAGITPLHALIEKDIKPQKLELMKKHVDQLKVKNFPHHMIRVTVTRDHQFLCEYNFLTHSVLTKEEALEKKGEFYDRNLYLQFINKKFNPDDKLDVIPPIPEEIFARPVWEKITSSIKKDLKFP